MDSKINTIVDKIEIVFSLSTTSEIRNSYKQTYYNCEVQVSGNFLILNLIEDSVITSHVFNLDKVMNYKIYNAQQ